MYTCECLQSSAIICVVYIDYSILWVVYPIVVITSTKFCGKNKSSVVKKLARSYENVFTIEGIHSCKLHFCMYSRLQFLALCFNIIISGCITLVIGWHFYSTGSILLSYCIKVTNLREWAVHITLLVNASSCAGIVM